MILIGQYDSPFVRRVGIALRLYDLPFTHQPWSSFSEADKIRPYNPLTRVPTLVLDDGDVLTESHAMLDYLDSLVPAERAMFPRQEPERHKSLMVATLATGLADKAVSLFYERRLHEQVSPVWSERCRTQIAAVLDVLEAKRAARTSAFWFGDKISHADIAIAVVLRFVGDVHGGVIDLAKYPALQRHAAHCEAMPVFQEISQPFAPPA